MIEHPRYWPLVIDDLPTIPLDRISIDTARETSRRGHPIVGDGDRLARTLARMRMIEQPRYWPVTLGGPTMRRTVAEAQASARIGYPVVVDGDDLALARPLDRVVHSVRTWGRA